MPCAAQWGRPAISHQDLKRLPNDLGVAYGLPCLVMRDWKLPTPDASSTFCSVGRIGISRCSVCGARSLPRRRRASAADPWRGLFHERQSHRRWSAASAPARSSNFDFSTSQKKRSLSCSRRSPKSVSQREPHPEKTSLWKACRRLDLYPRRRSLDDERWRCRARASRRVASRNRRPVGDLHRTPSEQQAGR